MAQATEQTQSLIDGPSRALLQLLQLMFGVSVAIPETLVVHLNHFIGQSLQRLLEKRY